ncbi:PhaM family polyhydroxyalkanoate granule multifunctional regulatory protein [Cupriavidus basilensis]|uniref:PhaM family polyhydroxyalkanoate granule multifunctional regulatory protein n=1 Tax=Cupriavidus basilensis TaxID=68895 RepID=UPI002840CC85|nr:PhaM family polyhydroxyalkanoate granule multifunctional regulatory protein [Cupriavidus basilensis]MDR3381641.1 hypothetical protein [Cupriavidus basilensis]
MFGQIPDFTNGFEFLRKMWGSAAGMPGGLMPGLQAMTPPMNLEDVDKRIHDLKAVEGWLQLNTNLLRTTIQGLEVQRATLVALQTIGTALSPEAMQSAMENVARAANSPSAAPYQQPAEPPAARRVWPEPTVEENEDEEDNGPDAPEAGQAQEPAAASGHTAGHAAGTGDAPPPDASLWWDVLQQQFNQIASSAATASMSPFGNLGNLGGFGMPGMPGTAAPEAAPAPAPAARPEGKAPASKARPAHKPASKAAGTKAGAKPAAKPAPKATRPASKKSAAAKPAEPQGSANGSADTSGEPS